MAIEELFEQVKWLGKTVEHNYYLSLSWDCGGMSFFRTARFEIYGRCYPGQWDLGLIAASRCGFGLEQGTRMRNWNLVLGLEFTEELNP